MWRNNMDVFSISFLILSLIGLLVSFVKDRNKTLKSMKKNFTMMRNMFGSIFGILLLIGIVLAIIPPETIKKLLGGNLSGGASMWGAGFLPGEHLRMETTLGISRPSQVQRVLRSQPVSADVSFE